MKIAAYNIQSEGFSSYNYELKKPERMVFLQKAIKTIGADFIGLIDTFRWEEVFSEKQIGKLFGYKSVYSINLNDDRLRKMGHNNGITIMSNLAVKKFKTVSLGTRDAVKARLVLEDNELDIFGVYLDDLSEDARLSQVKKLFTYVDDSIPTIMVGDFNSISKGDLERFDNFLSNNPDIKSKFGRMIEDFRRCEVIELIERKGLIDASSKKETTAPTELSSLGVKSAFARLDYAFCTSNISVKNFKVLKDDIFNRASDHFPIVFEVEI